MWYNESAFSGLCGFQRIETDPKHHAVVHVHFARHGLVSAYHAHDFLDDNRAVEQIFLIVGGLFVASFERNAFSDLRPDDGYTAHHEDGVRVAVTDLRGRKWDVRQWPTETNRKAAIRAANALGKRID